MEMIKEWVTNIILFILFATVLDMLLPHSKFQKYTKMVVGLLLIAIILTPIFKIFGTNFEETINSIPVIEVSSNHQIKNSIDLQKSEIQASQDAYILKQMAVQMEEDAKEELMDRYGLVISDLNLLVDENDQRPFPENLQKVVIQLSEKTMEAEAIEVVKPVEINRDQPQMPEKNIENEDRIIQLLAKKWNVNEHAIDLQIDGGD